MEITREEFEELKERVACLEKKILEGKQPVTVEDVANEVVKRLEKVAEAMN